MAELLPEQLRIMAAARPDEVAFTDVSTDRDLTFDQWERRSNQLARWLITADVAKGDRVAIHVPPAEPELFLIAYAAIHKAGAVAVPTSTRLVARELGFVLGHAGAVVAITGTSTLPALLEARPDLPALRRIVTSAPAAGASTGDGPMVAWDDATDPDDRAIQVPLTGADMADVMYTSGTTGRPKGVVVRHGNIAMVPNGLPRWTGSGWLHSSPMFTFAGIASVYNPMKLGMRLLYLPRFDVDTWFDNVEQRRPAAAFLVPAMAELLIASPRFDRADLSSLTMCPLGSAPVAPATLARLQERLPNAMVSNSWGMTEAGPAFCFMPPEEQSRRVGSVGRPMKPTEFRIIDDDGTDLAPRQIGQLLVRNQGREREYFGDPEATAEVWKDGWLHSGDLAYLDEDGFLYLVGRQKDVIIRGGNNVHAADVEAVLYEHPGVREAAVAGIEHPVLGEDIGAWVVRDPDADGEVGEEDLRAFSADRLSDFKVPRRWTFVDELPRNATGKVVKADLPGR
ncbi:class I adenylate-forming enzyme family protein [Aquihabitans sp. McL0605]|uniref:class I adenylate-forming enzyme family protein n=1 Tax=Aquihabitans sp. McL0605 TaxID=3415671 RepID=UPI003CF39B5A